MPQSAELMPDVNWKMQAGLHMTWRPSLQDLAQN